MVRINGRHKMVNCLSAVFPSISILGLLCYHSGLNGNCNRGTRQVQCWETVEKWWKPTANGLTLASRNVHHDVSTFIKSSCMDDQETSYLSEPCHMWFNKGRCLSVPIKWVNWLVKSTTLAHFLAIISFVLFLQTNTFTWFETMKCQIQWAIKVSQ